MVKTLPLCLLLGLIALAAASQPSKLLSVTLKLEESWPTVLYDLAFPVEVVASGLAPNGRLSLALFERTLMKEPTLSEALFETDIVGSVVGEFKGSFQIAPVSALKPSTVYEVRGCDKETGECPYGHLSVKTSGCSNEELADLTRKAEDFAMKGMLDLESYYDTAKDILARCPEYFSTVRKGVSPDDLLRSLKTKLAEAGASPEESHDVWVGMMESTHALTTEKLLGVRSKLVSAMDTVVTAQRNLTHAPILSSEKTVMKTLRHSGEMGPKTATFLQEMVQMKTGVAWEEVLWTIGTVTMTIVFPPVGLSMAGVSVIRKIMKMKGADAGRAFAGLATGIMSEIFVGVDVFEIASHAVSGINLLLDAAEMTAAEMREFKRKFRTNYMQWHVVTRRMTDDNSDLNDLCNGDCHVTMRQQRYSNPTHYKCCDDQCVRKLKSKDARALKHLPWRDFVVEAAKRSKDVTRWEVKCGWGTSWQRHNYCFNYIGNVFSFMASGSITCPLDVSEQIPSDALR